MFHPSRYTVAARIALVGLFLGIVGLLIQWFADGSKFAAAEASSGIPFPPGIVFILGCAALMVITSRWWWHPIFAVVAGVWIAGVGTLAGLTTPNLVSSNLGTVAGTAIMTAALAVATLAGLYALGQRFPLPRRRTAKAGR